MKLRNLAEDLKTLEPLNDFWEKGREDILLNLVKRGPILDVGCGAGTLTKPLLNKGFDVYAIDIDKNSYEYTKKFNEKTYCVDFSKIDTTKFPKVNTILLADILEHCKDDDKILSNAYKLLNKKGDLIITVPHHKMFWSKNDEARGHIRRYTKKELKQKVKDNGFRVKTIRYRNFLAIGPLLLGKIFEYRTPHESIAKSKLNHLLRWYFINIENKIRLPFGTELICVAYKDG